MDRQVTDLLGEHPRDDVAFGVTDLRLKSASSQRIAKLARGHWRIEPRWHEGRDMTLDEGRSPVRKSMTTCRNLAIDFIRRMK
jgi:hypothetical protein